MDKPFHQVKVRTYNQDLSRALQEKLFSLGYRWASEDRYAKNLDAYALCLEYGRITFFSRDWFHGGNGSEKEIQPHEILDYEKVEPEKKKMTVEEIEQELGYPIEVLTHLEGIVDRTILALGRSLITNTWTTASPREKEEARNNLEIESERWNGAKGENGMTIWELKTFLTNGAGYKFRIFTEELQ